MNRYTPILHCQSMSVRRTVVEYLVITLDEKITH